ncbi:MAG: hypothetical protein P4L26_11415 [Terracidiphilus sp.]|nr:hypothetical protein [Terracidiphilus sp.]
MTASSGDSVFRLSRLRFAAVASFAVLNLAVFSLRLLSVWKYGSLFSTQSGEFLMIYSIWKGMRHLPVYEWPFAFPFSLSLYNYLFYEFYAAVLRMIGAWDAGIETWGRLLTSLFAFVGAFAQWRLIGNRLNLRGARSLLSFLFALGLWLSTSIVRYWALTIRPDLPAAALVMAAFWMVLRPSRFNFALAGVFFYLAWSFKQSAVLTLAAVCLFLLFHKRWRDLSVLAGVFAVLSGATILLGTPEYRFSVLVAPRLIHSAFWFPVLWRALAHPLITNFYWMVAPLALLLAAGARRADRTVQLTATVFAIALLGGLAGMGTIGASDSYLLEAFVAGSTLFQIAVFTAPAGLVEALLLIGCLQPALQLTMIPSGRSTFGTVQLASPAEFANAVEVRDRLAQMKRPIFTTDQSFSLPWISTDDRAPALIIDHFFSDATPGRAQNGGFRGMLQRGEVPTVILNTGSPYEKDLSPNYLKTGSFLHQGVPYNQGVHYDIYTIGTPTPAADPPAK